MFWQAEQNYFAMNRDVSIITFTLSTELLMIFFLMVNRGIIGSTFIVSNNDTNYSPPPTPYLPLSLTLIEQ